METERDYETSLSAFMRVCKRLISKTHYTAAEYSEQHELGVGGVTWQLAQWADAALGCENKGTRPGRHAGELGHAGRGETLQY